MPELVLSDPAVDYVVIGEGEETIIDLIDCLEGNKDISTLDGISYKEKGKVKIIPKTKFIEDLDKLPFPARHLLNMEKYFGLEASHGHRKKKRFSPIVTSRGCPAGCTFCSAHRVWGRKFRARSAENVVAEMKHIKEKYGIEEIMFEDDNTTLNVQRAEKIFDLMIKEKLNFAWDTPNGIAAWTLNERLIDKMKESGCYKINLALESGSQYVLNNIIKKPLNLEKVKPFAKYAKKIGLDVGIFLIMGLPGETESQMKESFKLAAELGIWHPFVSVATPYPGSELYDTCLKRGYLNKDFSLDDLFIRSFSISTEDWDGARLKEIFKEGRKFLLLSYLKSQPFKFFIEYIQRFFASPVSFLKRLYIFVKGGGAERGKEDF
jgi:magnesium-protoporphyrin IX monomethyl ester (oxidative) cyclase